MTSEDLRKAAAILRAGEYKVPVYFDVDLLRLKGFKVDEMHAKSRERFLAHAGPDPKPSLLKRFLAWWDPK